MTHHAYKRGHEPSSRETQNKLLKRLLIEAYQEREQLLRDAYKWAPQTPAPAARTISTNASSPERARTAKKNGHIADGRTALPPMQPAQAAPQWVSHLSKLRSGMLGLASGTRDDSPPLRPHAPNEHPSTGAAIVRTPTLGTSGLEPWIKSSKAIFRTLFPPCDQDAGHDAVLNQLWRRGSTLILVFAGTLGFWLVAFSISSAVVASGQFVVDGSSKKIQHPTGGVVSEIFVREGDHVSAGDLLLRLDGTVTRSNFQVIAGQLDELAGRKARLEAERDARDQISVPPDLSSRMADLEVARIVASEQKLFDARAAARESQRAQLQKRISQLHDEIHGLRSQLDANTRETQIIGQELTGVRELYAKQLTPIMRLSAVERQAANLTGQRGQLAASIAQTLGKIAEIELQISQIDENLRSETQKELREVQGRIAELSERRVAALDVHKRIEIRAPSSGVVHQLNVHTVGGVITPAEPIMVVVPNGQELIVEAKVRPQDRDQIRPGQKVNLRVRSANQQSTPEFNGTVIRISADTSNDAGTAMPLYTVWVTVPKDQLSSSRSAEITVGMQTDVFIQTGSRSPLSYLLRPLTDQAQHAFRER